MRQGKVGEDGQVVRGEEAAEPPCGRKRREGVGEEAGSGLDRSGEGEKTNTGAPRHAPTKNTERGTRDFGSRNDSVRAVGEGDDGH